MLISKHNQNWGKKKKLIIKKCLFSVLTWSDVQKPTEITAGLQGDQFCSDASGSFLPWIILVKEQGWPCFPHSHGLTGRDSPADTELLQAILLYQEYKWTDACLTHKKCLRCYASRRTRAERNTIREWVRREKCGFGQNHAQESNSMSPYEGLC